ncbi:hypothetical protein EIP91_008363 [Steccherinum ochraceum]|uniref:Mannose-P-dolichol utilization defect 1 protein homolog n=1 Tax=Steccherinum ochraceum TaxID=92696 RepID=A0A4V2MV90_9APHY|nr:hypothetical protein EIP91_008363 [Steccherinum ochraceum]
MTAITRNLPWFIKDLGISIIGQKCYTTLVENLEVDNVECLKYSLSKGLGLGIVVGGSIMKVPQLLLIISARSARGLSLPAYVLETLSYAITLAYSYRNDFPFSTYGENFFLTIQNVIITLSILYYPTKTRLTQSSSSLNIAIALVATAVTGIALASVPESALSALQLSTIPLSLFSKVPQIRQNARAKSTGQLSAFAVIAQIAGCLARLFTTSAEVGDPILTAGFALALLLNVVLGVQMWQYWGKDILVEKVEDGRLMPETIHAPLREKETVPAYVQREASPVPTWGTDGTQSPGRASPIPRAGSPHVRQPSGRKWARKVD